MRQGILVLLYFVGLVVSSCNSEKQNVIKGRVEGLKVGDKIYLSVESANDETKWDFVDTTTVEKDGEFILKTKVTGDYVSLSYEGLDYLCFLEGYADLAVTGNANEWNYINISGGIYNHPDLQEAFHLFDSAKIIQKEGIKLLGEVGNDISETKGEKLIMKSNAIFRSCKPLELEFRKKHPELAYSAALLRYEYDTMEDFASYEAAFNAFTPEVQNSPAGIRIKHYIENTKASSAGAIAPDFTLTALDGQKITLSSFKGKYVLLDFWGSWCGGCIYSLPNLKKVYQDIKSKNIEFELIGIACGEVGEGWKRKVEEYQLTWVQLNDNESPKGRSLQTMYAVRSFPTCVLISPEGVILYRDSPNESGFVDKIDSYLVEKH